MLINTLIIITHYTYIEAAVDSNPPSSSQRYMQPTHTQHRLLSSTLKSNRWQRCTKVILYILYEARFNFEPQL